MTNGRRFLFGGIGALMPVLVTVLSLDVTAVAREGSLSLFNVLGISIRYVLLFGIGGFVAYLHRGEKSEIKLFELGIAAPALITSLVTAHGVPGSAGALSVPAPKSVPAEKPGGMLLIDRAYADEVHTRSPSLLAASPFGQLIDGITGKVYRDAGRVEEESRQRVEPSPPPPLARERTVFVDRIASGEAFRVIFDEAKFPDPGCNIDTRTSPLGSVKAQETYLVRFVPASGKWTVRGPNQGRPACGLVTATYSGGKPQDRMLNIWGRLFEFNDDGEVFDNNKDRNNGDPRTPLVGHIVFTR